MSALPTAKATQSSILSFFHQKQPKYAQPPQANGAPAPDEQQQQPAGPPPSTTRPSAGPPPPPAADKTSPAPTHTPTPAQTPAPAAASPHPQASIRPISPGDITALRRINSLLLPVAYPDAFYQHVLDPSVSALFSRAITWSDNDDDGSSSKVVGGIVCRLEEISPPGQGNGHVLYIQSLCLLSPYRSLGLAAAALDDVLAGVRRDPSIDVRSVYAHVWTENEDGLAWYLARGFVKSPKAVEDYYFKLRPASAWVVQKVLEHEALPAPVPTHLPASAVAPSATARLANLPPRGGPPRTNSGQSFQNVGPGAEWNDLPADMAPPVRGSGPNSGQSSRSSSSARKKRDRAYPAEAFGS